MNIGFYNLENLFDTIDSPDTEDAEFLPDGPKQWNTEQVPGTKPEQYGAGDQRAGHRGYRRGPAVVGLSRWGDRWRGGGPGGDAGFEGRGCRVAIRGPGRTGGGRGLISTIPHGSSSFGNGRSACASGQREDFRTRDQLMISGVMDGDTCTASQAHWPSRRGGQKRLSPSASQPQ